MRIAIIDDVLAEQDIIIKYVKEWAKEKKEIVEILRFQSSESFLFSWEEDKSYHLLILDIEMGKMNDIKRARSIYQNIKDYCALFSVVFQDFAIFDFPVGENVAATEEYNGDQVKEAIKKVGLDSIQEKMAEGMDTYVGKECSVNGVDFSGGEKQKIAIARAIYKDAPFVVMDEPTATLDPEAEAEVFEGFDKMVGNKTAIYISHRLASCKFCEDILVFDNGKVVQHGSHDELIAEEGMYRMLWNAQARYYA